MPGSNMIASAWGAPAAIAAILAALAALYLAAMATLYLSQRKILFRPDSGPLDATLVGLPDIASVTIPTSDGLRLHAWFVPPRPDAPVVLYLHGNAGHIGHRGERARRLAALGWGVLLVEYRGYGGNPGQPSEAGLIRDAEAGFQDLLRRGVPPGRIVLWGESLGSGVATALAAGPARNVAAVVLETPFTSIAAIAKARYPFAPVDLLLQDRFDSLSRIGAIRAPILIATGGRDTIVPPAMGRALLAAATASAELWHAEAGTHTDLIEHGLTEAAADFVARHLPAPAPVGEKMAP